MSLPSSAEALSNDGLWDGALHALGIPGARLLGESQFDPGRRVYAVGRRVFKISAGFAKPHPGCVRARTLREEGEILKRLAGLGCVPGNAEFAAVGELQCLSYDLVEGRPLSEVSGRVGLTLRLAALAVALARVSLRGIAHRDVLERNVLATPIGGVVLIDFDQAYCTTVREAFAVNFSGRSGPEGRSHGWYMDLVRNLSTRIVPGSLRRAVRWSRELIAFASTMPPRLDEGAAPRLHALREAWLIARRSNASAPGVPIAYYELQDSGHTFPGERPWSRRWEALRNAADVRGKRVLELGCNMSLLSCSLLRESGAAAALAVDVDARILASAQLVADAFGVAPQYKRVDLDAPVDWESELAGFRPDVVFALNVLNWVKDKARLLRFLARFGEVVFEGHDATDHEIERFRTAGFDLVDHVTTSERGRAVLRFRKSNAA